MTIVSCYKSRNYTYRTSNIEVVAVACQLVLDRKYNSNPTTTTKPMGLEHLVSNRACLELGSVAAFL